MLEGQSKNTPPPPLISRSRSTTEGVLGGGRVRGLVFLALSIQNIFVTCALASQYGGSGVGEEYKRSRFL